MSKAEQDFKGAGLAKWVSLTIPLKAELGEFRGLLTGLSATGLLIDGVSRQSAGKIAESGIWVVVYRGDATFRFAVTPGEPRFDGDRLILDVSSSAAELERLLGQVRKSQHIEICAGFDVECSDKNNGLDQWELVPRALPDLSWDDTDTRSRFLGESFRLPLLITGMTGGVEQGTKINRNLAEAASHFGIPMGVGSQRIALESREYEDIFKVKKLFPSLFLIGNIGAAQLVRVKDPVEYCERAVDMIQADALAIHLNVIQECIQAEGDRNFAGIPSVISEVCSRLSRPVMIKEVGAGTDQESVARLSDLGVRAVDVGGRGGTSWGYIEGLRSADPETMRLATLFRDWGLTTGECVQAASKHIREQNPDMSLVATGGIRNGVDVALACGLGADMAGVGLPLMRAAIKSTEAVHSEISFIERGLKIAMMGTGSRTVADISKSLRRKTQSPGAGL